MRRFFVGSDCVQDGRITIAGRDARHIERVLRLRPGDLLSAMDGTGCEHTARITEREDHEHNDQCYKAC
ncbi:MAG: RNA methyltransferase PUA domain-containing protein [Clostridia bacterium]|nr:RNA methyltransferase PUA domain-containing protein [Clostridia bacterium]